MPFAGLGIHIVLALMCAIHVVRSGQQLYWLIILFSFPLLGSLVYFLVIYLPNSRLQHGARRAVSAAARAIDPTREVREARAALDETPTAQNQMRLAAALLEVGQTEEAARMYEKCLAGPFSSDLEIQFGAGRAFAECQRFPEALRHLESVRSSNPAFRADAVSLLLARSYAGASRPSEARAEFESAVAKFGTFESFAEYAIWAMAIDDKTTVERLNDEISKITRRWNSHARELNAPVMRRLEAARSLSKRSA